MPSVFCKLADLNADEIELHLRKRLRDRVRVKTAAGYIDRQELKPATVHPGATGPAANAKCRRKKETAALKSLCRG